jgi:CRP-like cAMP-binding protein
MDYSLLLKAPLFSGLSVEEIERMLAKVSHRTRKFKSGTLIVQSGEQVNSLMVVIKGIVKGEMTDFAGRVIKIEDIPAPGALAPAFLFGSKNRYPVNIIVVSDAELLFIEKLEFLKLLMRSDRILVNFLDLISNRSQFLSEKIKFLNFKTIKGKLAQFILQRAGGDKSNVILEITQNDLADFFGVARPSVARALGEIEDEGLIEARGKNIKILDRAGLVMLTAD